MESLIETTLILNLAKDLIGQNRNPNLNTQVEPQEAEKPGTTNYTNTPAKPTHHPPKSHV